MTLGKLIVAALCISLVTSAAAGLFLNSDVIELDSATYKEHGHEGVWFIMYYITGCRGCHMVADTWKTTATNLKGKVRVAALDLQAQKADVAALRGFPTIRFLVNGQFREENVAVERTPVALTDYALGRLKQLQDEGAETPSAERPVRHATERSDRPTKT